MRRFFVVILAVVVALGVPVQAQVAAKPPAKATVRSSRFKLSGWITWAIFGNGDAKIHSSPQTPLPTDLRLNTSYRLSRTGQIFAQWSVFDRSSKLQMLYWQDRFGSATVTVGKLFIPQGGEWYEFNPGHVPLAGGYSAIYRGRLAAEGTGAMIQFLAGPVTVQMAGLDGHNLVGHGNLPGGKPQGYLRLTACPTAGLLVGTSQRFASVNCTDAFALWRPGGSTLVLGEVLHTEGQTNGLVLTRVGLSRWLDGLVQTEALRQGVKLTFGVNVRLPAETTVQFDVCPHPQPFPGATHWDVRVVHLF